MQPCDLAQPRQFAPRGFWRESLNDHHAHPVTLPDKPHFDVVIIGAGFTGLSAARALADAGRSVCVIERDQMAGGASGHNSGHVGLNLGMGAAVLRRVLGKDGPARYGDLLMRAVENVGTKTRDAGVDCDYSNVGNLTAAVDPVQHEKLSRKFEEFLQVGFPVEFLDRPDLDLLGVPVFVTAAIHEKTGGCIHPAKYARALGDLAQRAGAIVLENTPAISIDLDKPVTVRTERATITADAAILATNAYTAELGVCASHYLPLSVSLFVTQPLNAEQRQRIGWDSGIPMHTNHEIIENHRFTHDGRLLIGTKRVQHGYGTAHPPANNPEIFRALHTVLRERYPHMPDLFPDIGWTGRVAVSSDSVPFLRRVGEGNVILAAGYGGNGVPLASYMGALAARLLVNGTLGEDQFLTSGRSMRLPTKVLRYGVSAGLLRVLNGIDDRADKAARRNLQP